jgi:periplasmic protein TonB
MEAKKSPKADLEKKKSIFLQVGLVATLVVVLVAFEWKQYERPEYDLFTMESDFIEEEDIPITRPEEPPPPPPPEPSTELVIVDDDVEVDDDFKIDVEATIETQVREFIPVVYEEEEVDENYIFEIVEENPEFPGGNEAMMKYLRDNTRYPVIAREAGIQGTVFVTFVVERDGSVTNVSVLRGIGGGCDEEAVRVVRSMPKWKPGKQRNQPVRVQYRMPIRFVLS